MIKKLLSTRSFAIAALAILMILPGKGWGQQSITSTSAIVAAFTGYLGTATAPTNWTFSGNTSFQGTNQAGGASGGWYGNNNVSFLGSGSASNGNCTWQLRNNSGSTISGFTLSFAARMWKSGSSSPSVTVTWSNSASSTASPASGALTNSLSSLTFNDATANISTGTTLTQTISSLNIANGQYIYIRIIHAGGSSSDNLGWDDVTFTPTLAIGLTPPTISAAGNATVDNAFDVTFTEDATWRAAITSITYDGTTIASAAYDKTQSGKITFTPSLSSALQTAKTNKDLVILATGYNNATIQQTIGAGAATKLGMVTEPTAPLINGLTLAQQPVVAIQDQYGNLTSSSATITAAKGDAGSWTLGGTSGVAGPTATFTNLSASSSAAVTGAKVTFTSGSLTSVSSAAFNIPAPNYISLVSSGSAATEDFNTLASTGTSTTVPTGWGYIETGSGADGNYTASTGSATSGDTYSFGALSNTERAFGSMQSGSVISTIGVIYKNNTGGVIKSLSISYTGEQWRLGTIGREDRLDFQYSLDATSLNTGTWTDVDNLDFVAPVTSGTTGAVDGNVSPNRTAKSYTITGLSIANGSLFVFRLNDFNATSADDGLGIDDWSLTAFAAPTIASFAPNNGCAGSNTPVTITGTNFTDATAVSINGTAVQSFSVTNATTISATTATSTTGTGKISVTTPGGTATSTGDFTINSIVPPTFTQLGPYCVGATPGTLLSTSSNGINGTWNTAISTVSEGSTVYTFTPTAGQCATQATMTVVVNANVTPTFIQIGPYIAGDTPAALPGTSTNGITGTWNPATISTAAAGKTTYTFTPTAGQCATTTTMDITVTEGTKETVASGSWTDGTTWSGGTVPLATDNVTIKHAVILTGSGDCNKLDITTGSLTINSGASLITNGAVTGNATVKSDIEGGKWHLISSPVSGALSGSFSGKYLQSHSEASNLYSDIKDLDVALTTGTGFALWGGAGFTHDYFGPLNTGTKLIGGLTRTNISDALNSGWNLIGNPYPSVLDWDAVNVAQGSTGINNAIYIEDGNAWATYNNGVGTPKAVNQYIAPGQGFFVQVKVNTTSGAIDMENSARVHTSATFYKKASVTNLARLQVSGNSYTDEAVVRFASDATSEFDGNYDAHKFFSEIPGSAQIYTLGSSPLAINALLPETNEVPLGIRANTAGTYTIAATQLLDMPSATLEDTQTGIFTDLSAGSYSFTAGPGEKEVRFILHFNTSVTSLTDPAKSLANIYSYQNTAFIDLKDQAKGNIFIYNVSGQLIRTQAASKGMNEVKLPNTGIYMVKVITAKSTMVKKIWIE